MREVSPAMERTWIGGDYTGNNRPIARVTVAHPDMAFATSSMARTYPVGEFFTPTGTPAATAASAGAGSIFMPPPGQGVGEAIAYGGPRGGPHWLFQ